MGGEKAFLAVCVADGGVAACAKDTQCCSCCFHGIANRVDSKHGLLVRRGKANGNGMAPINHLEMLTDQLPETGAAMKDLFERISRFVGEGTLAQK